ncbi:hypothetical protein FQR65_LT12607 [Abscondita terminalis]|nr:hypothetical protein FQR65_LT12607 [Abscondita terminalis]
MLRNIWWCLMCVVMNTILTNSLPSPQCSEYIDKLKMSYKEYFLGKDIDISKSLNKGYIEINSIFAEFDEKLRKLIELAIRKGCNVYKCFDYDEINNVKGKLINKYTKAMNEIANRYHRYISISVNSIDSCYELYNSCMKIKNCFESVVNNFDNDLFENGLKMLEAESNKQITDIKRDMDQYFLKLKKQIWLCCLELLLTSTTIIPITSTTQTSTLPLSTATTTPNQPSTERTTTTKQPDTTSTAPTISTTEPITTSTAQPIEPSTTETTSSSSTGTETTETLETATA